MELLKDYDVIIQYKLGKVNMVVKALSQKPLSISILSMLSAAK